MAKPKRKKRKKGRPPKVDVKGSKPHRRRAHWVSGHWKGRTKKAHRNDPHKRNQRRTQKEIAKKGTRKQERKKKHKEKIKQQTQAHTKKQKVKKTRQTTIGNRKPRGPSKVN